MYDVNKAIEEFKREYSDEKMWSIVTPTKEKKIRKNASTRKGVALVRKLKAHISECEECGSTDRLNIHHIDKNNANNDFSNLVKLCLSCHMKQHEGEPVRRIMNKRFKDYV